MPVYPITFSIAECKVVISIPNKIKFLSSLVPGDLSTYIYTTEEEYYKEYRDSYFATTVKKGGWDCTRHYEILACGSIPYFPSIEKCPPRTMALLPKDMIIEGNALYRRYKDLGITDEFKRLYMQLASRMLKYTQENLTTKKMAQYILDTVGKPEAKRILFLSGDQGPDYLRCLTLGGFKELLGTNCHDFPKINHIYKDAGIKYSSLYGKGFTYTNLIEQTLHNNELDSTILIDIHEHKYDLILYGSYHRGIPYYDIIMKIYKVEEVILLCGEDLTCGGNSEHMCSNSEFISRGHPVFIRELQG